jgi:large subunit ribosomal protein L4
LKTLGIEPSVLLVTAEPDMNVVKSARNIDRAKTLPAAMLNVVDLLSHRMLLMTVDAVRRVEAIWGRKQVVAEAQAS